MKLKPNLFIFVFLLCISCNSSANMQKETSEIQNKNTYNEECSKFYPFDNKLIDLELLKVVEIDGLPAENFKTCSKYAHRFRNPISDSVLVGGKLFVVVNDKKNKKYQIEVFEKKKLIKTIKVPVEEPLPKVHEYYIHLLPYKNNVILQMSDMYTTHYRLVKYDVNGAELIRKEVEHTYITHPEPRTNHYNRYLYYYGITNSQMIFTSHMAFADRFKTILLDLNDFSVEEYDKRAHGIILDENDDELIGFATSIEDYDKKSMDMELTMIKGDIYSFTLPYGMPACSFLLKGSLLYVATYHPISTGSDLHCFNLKSKKIQWRAKVKQLKAEHSEYQNKVTLSLYKNKLLMEGNESYGGYLQVFDCFSGERITDFGFLD